jgi:CRP-like cAMP-binding protein
VEQTHVYVVKSGWCSCARHLSDGRRQITRFALPGDFLCFDSIVAATSVQDIVAITEVTLLQLKVETLGEIAARAPRLAVAILWAAAQDESALAERLTSLGRRYALERLSHLFVETYCRLNALGLASDQRLFFPVTKEQLADAMGLTTIHIYRTLRRLTEDGLIALEGSWLTIHDLEGLSDVAKFDSRYIQRSRMPDDTKRMLEQAF